MPSLKLSFSAAVIGRTGPRRAGGGRALFLASWQRGAAIQIVKACLTIQATWRETDKAALIDQRAVQFFLDPTNLPSPASG